LSVGPGSASHRTNRWSQSQMRPCSVAEPGRNQVNITMTLSWHFLTSMPNVPQIAARWRGLRLPFKVAVGASALVAAGMVYLGTVVAGHIRENVLQKRASATALYMSNFVERHIQELESRSTLSDENRAILEGLLSPASMHRPIIAFRVWKGDTVAFSNER